MFCVVILLYIGLQRSCNLTCATISKYDNKVDPRPFSVINLIPSDPLVFVASLDSIYLLQTL